LIQQGGIEIEECKIKSVEVYFSENPETTKLCDEYRRFSHTFASRLVPDGELRRSFPPPQGLKGNQV
jgi:hypothetical protein